MTSRPNKFSEQVNLPNALTLGRLLLVPVFLWLLWQNTPGYRWVAAATFVVAAYTDMLDGKIARARNLETDFGKLADPLADKFLTLGAFVVFSLLGELGWWFTVIVAVREVGITVLREVLRRRGQVVPASSGGKVKTVLQMGLIIALIIPWSAFVTGAALQGVQVVILTLVWVTLVVTVWTGIQYLVATVRTSGDQKAE